MSVKSALLSLLLVCPALPAAAHTTKILLPAIANHFRKGGTSFPLGGESYRITLLPNGGGGWTYFLVGPEGSYMAPDAVIPSVAVTPRRDMVFEGYDYEVSFRLPKLYNKKSYRPDLYQINFLPQDNPRPSPGWGHAVGATKINTWEAAEPVPVLGKRWRLLYRNDTKEGGPTIEQLYLLERQPEVIYFHFISMKTLEKEGRVDGTFGGKKVSIRLRFEGWLHIVILH